MAWHLTPLRTQKAATVLCFQPTAAYGVPIPEAPKSAYCMEYSSLCSPNQSGPSLIINQAHVAVGREDGSMTPCPCVPPYEMEPIAHAAPRKM